MLIVTDSIEERAKKVRALLDAIRDSELDAPLLCVLVRDGDEDEVIGVVEGYPRSLGVILADPMARMRKVASYQDYAMEFVRRMSPVLEMGEPMVTSYSGAGPGDLVNVMKGAEHTNPLGTLGYSRFPIQCEDPLGSYRGAVRSMLRNLLVRVDLSGLRDSRLLVLLRGPGDMLFAKMVAEVASSEFDGKVVRVADIVKEEKGQEVELIGVIGNIPRGRFGIGEG